VLVVENGPCRIIEVDRAGKIAKEIKLRPPPASVTRMSASGRAVFPDIRFEKDCESRSRTR